VHSNDLGFGTIFGFVVVFDGCNLEAFAKDGQRRLDIGQAVGEGLSLAQGLIQTGKGFEGVPGTFDRLSDPLNVFAKEQAMDARNRQLEYLTQRWEKLPGQDLSASLALENLLNAQTQLGQAEYDFLQSQMTYNLSLTNLKKSTGTLLQHESVSLSDTCVGKLPTRIASKPNLGPQ